MLNITIACIGKLKEAYWRDACAEYAKRLQGFCKLNVVQLDEVRLPDNPSEALIEAALQTEGERLLAHIPTGAAVIALCIEGKPLSSTQLSEQLSKWTVEGISHVVMIIGSSFGLSAAVKQAAKLRLSMSPMTFPHQLARVMVLEQVYRALQIAAGGKYHK